MEVDRARKRLNMRALYYSQDLQVTSPISDPLLKVFDSFLTCEFSYITKSGPITFPVVSFYERSSDNFLVLSSVAYSSKISSINRNPRVSLLFSNPACSGLERGSPIVLVQGDAHIDGNQDLNEWRFVLRNQPPTKKVVALKKKLKTLDSRMKFWPVRTLFEYYTLRVTIKIHPKSVRVWDRESLAQGEDDGNRKEETNPWAITVIDGHGYPFSFPVSKEGITERVNGFAIAPPSDVHLQGSQSCCMLSHSCDSNYNHIREKIIRGTLGHQGAGYFLVPIRSYNTRNPWLDYLIAGRKRAKKYLKTNPRNNPSSKIL
jgi:hypothetical protein